MDNIPNLGNTVIPHFHLINAAPFNIPPRNPDPADAARWMVIARAATSATS